MAVPVWQAPVAGQQALAGHVNQLLGTHPATFLYQGTLQSSATGGSNSDSSVDLWHAQRFTTGSTQTTVGYVTFPSTVTGSPDPWTISVQADVGGQPSGTPLAQAGCPREFAASQVTALLPCAVTPGTQYWIVAAPQGDLSDYFTWGESTAGNGCLTSSDGITWTAQPFGLRYQVYDQSPVPPLLGIVEDNGARYTLFSWSGTAGPSQAQEYTTGQTPAGYVAASRTWSYSGPLLTGVT